MPLSQEMGISNWRRLSWVSLGAILAVVLTWAIPLIAQTIKCTCTVFTTGSYDNGSAGAPAISFNNDPTKGFYRFNSGVIGVSGAIDFGADATYDIGATNRPRDVRLSRNLTAGGTATFTGNTSTSGTMTSTLGNTAQSVQWVTGGAMQPTCDVSHRDMLWIVPGGAGVWDSFELCAKDDSDAYKWHQFVIF